MPNTPLHPQALALLAAAGIAVESHKLDAGLWVYTLPTGQQGQAESPQRAAALALDHLRGAVVELAELVDALTDEIAELRAQAGAAGAVALRLAEGRER